MTKMDPIKGLYDYLKSKEKLGNVDEAAFRQSFGNEDGLRRLHAFMVENNLTSDAEDVFVRGHIAVTPEKKNQLPKESGIGSAETVGSDLGARTFAGQEVPAPVAPGQEKKFVEEGVAPVATTDIPGLPGTPSLPSAGVKSNTLSNFGMKGADEAIDEVRQARNARRQVSPYPGVRVEESSPTVEKMKADDRTRPLSERSVFEQGMAKFGATGGEVLANLSEAPEYIRQVGADVAFDMLSGPLKRQLRSGEISEEQYRNIKSSAKDQMMSVAAPGTPNQTLRAIEDLSDEYGSIDKWADKQRANARLVNSKIENANESIESLLSQKRYGDALRKTGIEVLGSLPYTMMAMVPGVGIPSVGLSASKGKYEQMVEEGYDMGAKEAINSVLTGAFEGLSEAVSARIGKEALKMATRYGRDFAVQGTKRAIAMTMGKILGNSIEEASSEVLAQLAENIVDKATIDRDKNIFEGLLDAAIIGAASGGGMTAAGAAVGATPMAVAAVRDLTGFAPTEEGYRMKAEALRAKADRATELRNKQFDEQQQPSRQYSEEAKQIATQIPVSDTDDAEGIRASYDAYLDKVAEQFGQESPEYSRALTRGEEVVGYLTEQVAAVSDIKEAVQRIDYLDEAINDPNITPETKQQLEQERAAAETDLLAKVQQNRKNDFGLTEDASIVDVQQMDLGEVNADPALSAAYRVAEALKGIGVSVVVANEGSEQKLEQTFGKDNAAAVTESRASYVSDGQGGKVIVLNRNSATSDSALHEGFHAIIEHAATQRPEQVDALMKAIRPHVNELAPVQLANGETIPVGEYLDRFMAQYSENQQSEEFLSELGAVVSQGLADVKDKTVLGRIEKAINDFIAAIIGENKLVVRLTTSGDAVALFNTMQKGLQYGDRQSVQQAMQMFGRAAKGKRGVFRNAPKRKKVAQEVTVQTNEGDIQVMRQRGVINLTEQDAIKFAKAGVNDKYSQQAIKSIGLQGVKFTSDAIEARIKEEFDKLLGTYEDYLVSKDSEAITREIEQEFEAMRLQGISDENIRRLREIASTDKHRQERINNYRSTQKNEAANWVGYLKQSDYPVAFKYLILDAVLTNNYDFATDKYHKRTDKTLRGITPFDAGSLAVLYTSESNELLKDYASIQADNAKNIADTMAMITTDEGKWIKFSGQGDAAALSQLVQNTPWCTKTLASSQLKDGDFYVFTTEGSDGKPIPRVAVRMEGDKVGEVRGVKSERQDIEDSMLPIANDFLRNNIPNDSGREWIDSNEYNQRVIDVTNRIVEERLTVENLKEAIGLISTQDQFTTEYGSNGNVERLQTLLNFEINAQANKDRATWVATSIDGINEDTKALMTDEWIGSRYYKGGGALEYFEKLSKLDIIATDKGIDLRDLPDGINFKADTLFANETSDVSIGRNFPSGVKEIYGRVVMGIYSNAPTDLTRIYGTFMVTSEDTGSVEEVTGSLVIDANADRFERLSKIKRIGGNLTFTSRQQGGLAQMVAIKSLGELTEIGGKLELGDNLFLSSFGKVKRIKYLVINGNIGTNEIDGPESVGKLRVSLDGDFSLGTLQRVDGQVSIARKYHSYIPFVDFPKLDHIGGQLFMAGVKYNLGPLKYVGEDISIDGAEGVSGLGIVDYIGGDLKITDDSSIKNIDVGYIGGGIKINGISAEVEITTPKLSYFAFDVSNSSRPVRLLTKEIGKLGVYLFRKGDMPQSSAVLEPFNGSINDILDISGVESVAVFNNQYTQKVNPGFDHPVGFEYDEKTDRYVRIKTDGGVKAGEARAETDQGVDIRQQKQLDPATALTNKIDEYRQGQIDLRRQIEVYHGTWTDKIDRFSTEYIGTGEGAQVFGWGLYFTNSKAIAKWYKDTVSKNKNEFRSIKNRDGIDINKFIKETDALINGVHSTKFQVNKLRSEYSLKGSKYSGEFTDGVERSFGAMYSSIQELQRALEDIHSAAKQNASGNMLSSAADYALARYPMIISHIESIRQSSVYISDTLNFIAENLSKQSGEFSQDKIENGVKFLNSIAEKSTSIIGGSEGQSALIDQAAILSSVNPEKLTDDPINVVPSIYTAVLHGGRSSDDYLIADWDSSINNQPRLLDAMNKLGMFKEHSVKDRSFMALYVNGINTGLSTNDTYGEIYNKLTDIYANEKGMFEEEAQREVSLFMLSMGIDGTMYKAGQLSGVNADPDSYNYVIYDDTHTEIKAVETDQGVEVRQQKQIDPTEKLRSESPVFDLSDFATKSSERILKHHEEAKERYQAMFDQHPASVQTDELSSLTRAGKAFVAFEKGGSIGNVSRIDAAISDNARPLYEMATQIGKRIVAMKDGSISKEEVVRGAIIASFEKSSVSVFDVLGVTGAIDDVFVSHENLEQVVKIEDALSLIANTPGGMDSAEAKQLLSLYDKRAENRVEEINSAIDTYTQSTQGIVVSKIGPKINMTGNSVPAAIAGFGRVRKDSLLHKIATGYTPKPGADYKITPLSSRASIIAQATGQKTPVLEAYLASIWNAIPAKAKDDAFFELAQNEFGFELQVMAMKEGDAGIDVRQQKASPALRANPNYKAARKYVKDNYDRIPDKEIVQNLKSTLGMFESDALELFQIVSGREYRAPGSPMAGAMEDGNRFWRAMGKLLADTRVKNMRDFAYSFDFRFGNFLAPLRKMQREIEKNLGMLLPSATNAYDAMQLHASAALYELQAHTLWFYGDAGSLVSKKNSFVGRITKALGGINNFNEFLLALHLPERLSRKIDLTQKYLADLSQDLLDKTGQTLTIGSPTPNAALQARADADASIARLIAKWQKANSTLTEQNVKYQEAITRQLDMVERIGGAAARTAVQNGADISSVPELRTHMDFYQEFRDRMLTPYLDALMAAGRIDQKRYDHLLNGTSDESDVQWQYYVPMMYSEDAINHEQGITNGDRIVNLNGIEGLSKPYDQKTRQNLLNMEAEDVVRPLELAFARLASAVRQKHKQDSLRRFAELVRQYGDTDRLRVFAARNIPKSDKYGNVVGAQNLLPAEILENSVPFYEGGKVKYIYFSDPGDKLFHMLKSPDAAGQINMFERVLSLVMNGMRIGITSLSPTFIFNNFLRDIQESSINIGVENELLQLPPAQVRRAWRRRWKDAVTHQLMPFMEGARSGTEMARYYAEYEAMGSPMSFNYDSGEMLMDLAKGINKRIRDAEELAASDTNFDLSTEKNRLVEGMMSVSARFENVSRLAAYAAMRDLGVDPIRAASIAKNITLNFEKKGQFFKTGGGRLISGLYLFLNAGLQSGRKLVKQLATPAGRRMLALYGAGSIAFRVVLHALYGLGDDDDEKEELQSGLDRYMNSAFVRQFYMAIPNPADMDDPLLLPRPYGSLRVVGALADGAVDVSMGKRSLLSATTDVRDALLSSIDPIGGFSGEITNFAPTAVRPFAEAWANRDWMGRQILFSREESRKYAQANKNTLKIYKDITPVLYDFTPFSISPTHLEHIVESYAKMFYPVKLSYSMYKANEDFQKAIAEKSKTAKDKSLMQWMVDQGRVNMIIYKPNLSQNERQDLYNFMTMAEVKAKVPFVKAQWADQEIQYMQRAVKVIRREKLARDQDINAQVLNMALEMQRNGQLDRKSSDGTTYRTMLSRMISSGGRENFRKKLREAEKGE